MADGEPPPENFRRILIKLESEKGAIDLLRFFNEQVLREQEIFWQRFYAFSTLHAGGFILASSVLVQPKWPVAAAGFLLGFFWVWAQWLSLGYADRFKAHYHDLRKWLGVDFAYENADSFGARLKKNTGLSSTDLGLWVTIFVAGAWGVYLVISVLL